MAKNLMGREVPEAMHRQATGIVARGGRAFVCKPEGSGGGSCDNCDGWGHHILQHIVGGPFDNAPHSSGGSSATFIDDAWYLVESHQWQCARCGGTGKAQQRKTQPDYQPVAF